MKKELIVIADTGVIISLAVIDTLSLLTDMFKDIYIPQAVWMELKNAGDFKNKDKALLFFQNKVKKIESINNLFLIMDNGESEAAILYKDVNADLLLIDDKHARVIAESIRIKCIGTLGLLIIAKEKGFIRELQPIFRFLLENKRYYSPLLLNSILKEQGEKLI